MTEKTVLISFNLAGMYMVGHLLLSPDISGAASTGRYDRAQRERESEYRTHGVCLRILLLVWFGVWCGVSSCDVSNFNTSGCNCVAG